MVNMKVENLGATDFFVLMACFLKAFEGYFVKMPTDYEYYKERWRMANVRLDLSYGMFDNEKLVGFIINAIGMRNGNWIAFNTGTGVLPEYRGQRIIGSIYQHAIPDLKKHSITKCRLEVIKANSIAIKAYEHIGFKITKSYKCYNGSITLKEASTDFELKEVDRSYFNWTTLNQESYSWDNHYHTVKKGKYHYYAIYIQGKLESYFIINPKNGYLAQFNVLSNRQGNWTTLFEGIKQVADTIKINNVDEQLVDKVNFLNRTGLQNTIDQYEMELDF